MKNKDNSELENKVREGLKLVTINLIAFKKRMNSELVVLQNDKIVRIKPEQTFNKQDSRYQNQDFREKNPHGGSCGS